MSLRRRLRDGRHARLLERARDGDGGAFRTLYQELFPPVAGFLARRLAHREDVEDLTSHVFHRFLEQLDRFDRGRGSVASWILTMAHHALVDHVRRRRPPADETGALSVAAPSDSEPLERVLRWEREEAVGALLAGLPPGEQHMVEMRYAMDLSYAEIAGVLEISEDAVKQRFSRLHRRLRAAAVAEKEES